MSRVGRRPVESSSGVQVQVAGREIRVTGKLGELRRTLPSGIEAVVEGGRVEIRRTEESRRARSCHGLVRRLVANMIQGVSEGFTRQLTIEGVGFKATVDGRRLSLWLGFSRPLEYEIPEEVRVTVQDGINLTVSGSDKEKVGDVAARIRSFFPAEPYQGKGIRYVGERIRRKAGKTVA